jgi:hypothetical protein
MADPVSLFRKNQFRNNKRKVCGCWKKRKNENWLVVNYETSAPAALNDL